ncbi:hypothetical protein G4G27_15310 [Sphingomonas sp. So64.6b]|uniref:Ig-like domain-containing protein n=1 Tax=Sphingomonas sp. So64.6b TaxID=2997354 RepID=UPI0015FF6BB7|nr:Ig-like domain-containing protein [Sphingomonas sp. So64.6b]QNA85213.1 hypothetical protein G4G27_15310 [Sphingomonas sp. So64.6b]
MRRTISSLMVLGMMSGCGGGNDTSGTTAPAGDTQAPVLTLAAPATIEGGQTVALNATVTDNVSTGLTPAITCTGGTLTGTMLATPVVTAATTITCTATATDAAGNRGSASVSISVQPTTATLAPASGLDTLRAGQFGLLVAANLPLTEESYTGTLDGNPVTLLRGGADALGFAVPGNLAAGAHRLNVTIGTRSYSFTINTTAAPAVGDAKTVVRDALTASKASIDALLAADGATMTSAVRAILTDYSAKLGTGLSQIDGFTAAELADMAIVLQANSVTAASLRTNGGARQRASAISITSCDLAAVAAGVAVTGVVALTIGGKLTIRTGTVPGVLVGVVLSLPGAIAAGYAAGLAMEAAYGHCVDEVSAAIKPADQGQSGRRAKNYVAAIAVANRTGFRNKVASNFTVEVKKAVDPASVGLLATTYSLFAQAIGSLTFAPEALKRTVKPFVPEYSETVPSAQISLGAISVGTIAGSKGGSGDIVTLTFKTTETQPAEQNVNFDFVLNNSGGQPINVPAQLIIALPGADDAAISTTQDELVSSTVQVRGADTLEVVTQPAHGTVTLRDSGAFAYTPADRYFGSDSFTYRARNAEGVSRTATVAITVVRKFDGQWNMTSRTTTTSQSQPGLCPNETNSFSITVSKISDTQYTTSYQGFPITLTMSSKDDPAGLAGSTTVTYDDDPGQTTETVNARIPDSSHITASGSFSYSGPNNSRCSGTTSVTGVRP